MKKYCTHKRAWKQSINLILMKQMFVGGIITLLFFLFFFYTPIFSRKEAMSRLSYFIALLPKLVLGAAVLASHVRVVGF